MHTSASLMKVSRALFLPGNNRLKLVFRAVGGQLWQGRRTIDGGSNARWGRTGSLSTAALASEPEKSSRSSRKRVSRDVRKAMVESFVNKYRAENEGQFPNTTVAQKEVGGSFYVIRGIMQELEYASKHGPQVETCKYNSARATLTDSEKKISSKVDEIVKELSTSHSRIEALHERTVEVNNVPIVGVTPGLVAENKADGERERLSAQNQDASSLPSSKDWTDVCPGDVSVLQEVVVVDSADDSCDVPRAHPPENVSESITKEKEDEFDSMPSHLPKEDCGSSHGQEVVLGQKSEKSMQDTSKSSISSSKTVDGRKSSDLNRAQPYVFTKDLSLKTMDEVSAEKKSSSLWSNLKSFAGSIISIWKK